MTAPKLRRPGIERLAFRAPWLTHLALAGVIRLPPESELRRRCILSLVAGFTEMVNREEIDRALLLAFEPDVDIRVVGFAIGTPDRYLGHDGMRDFFADWRDAMGWPHFTVDRVMGRGRSLLIGLSFRSHGRASGAEAAKNGLGFVVSLSDRGRVQAWEMFWDWDEALGAFDGRESRA